MTSFVVMAKYIVEYQKPCLEANYSLTYKSCPVQWNLILSLLIKAELMFPLQIKQFIRKHVHVRT